MKIPSNITTLIAGILLTLVSLWFGQHHGLLPIAATEDAVRIDGLFNAMMTVSIGLFLLVQGIIIIAAIRFRRRPGDTTDGPPIEGNIPLEILWTAIPAVIVLVISIYSFDVYKDMGGFDPEAGSDHHGVRVEQTTAKKSMPGAAIAATLSDESSLPASHHHDGMPVAAGVGAPPEMEDQPAALTVDVTGIQYAWLFSYPGTNITAGELHVPVGKEVKLRIMANDVLHAFWVPEFRLKQDAIPGRQTELRFVATRTGDYPLICAELCGPYHGAMKSRVFVDSAEDYEAWIQAQLPAPDAQTAAAFVPASDRTPDEFLAPYVEAMGIDSEAIAQMHAHHHSAS